MLTERWDALLAEVIGAGIQSGVFKETNVGRTVRQLGSMLNGYSDQLIVDSNPATHQQTLEDIEAFIQVVLLA
ncbi:hypothetical protein D3C79_1013010 [compost metagenome]